METNPTYIVMDFGTVVETTDSLDRAAMVARTRRAGYKPEYRSNVVVLATTVVDIDALPSVDEVWASIVS